jgi:membrane-bound inhibitor of C-type lysozyme
MKLRYRGALPNMADRHMLKPFWLLAIVTGLVLEGCVVVQPQVTVLPAEIAYVCQNNSPMKVLRAPDGRSAAVWFDGKNTNLMRVDSAAQEKYSDGRTTLYLDGEKAVMSSDSFVVAGGCVSTRPLPMAPMTPTTRY